MSNQHVDALRVYNKSTERRYRYLLLKELGQGAGAVVYQADKYAEGHHDRESNVQRVAVKVAFSLKQKNYLVREGKLYKRLHAKQREGNISRIVRVHEGGELLAEYREDEDGAIQQVSNGRWALELEYLPGRTLRAWMTEWFARDEVPLQERLEQMVRFARELAEALDELSSSDAEAKIIHRDIKPANVMVTAEGLRLFDFNAARLDGEELAKTKGVGTQGYFVPEVLASDDYDHRADLFALGIIAWEILHRRRLFPVMTDVLRYDTEGSVLPWPTEGEAFSELPEGVQVALSRLMTGLLCHKDRRLPSAAAALEQIHTLDEALEAMRKPVDPAKEAQEAIAGLDMIGLLMELRPSGQASVVADMDTDKLGARQRYIRTRTRVADPLEDYLVARVESLLERTDQGPALLMLAGNAGDGKSYLIDRLVHHALSPAQRARLHYIADATHALAPDESQQARLEAFFAPFAQGHEGEVDDKLHLIAMNTGMVIRFFEQAPASLGKLKEALHRQLGLARPGDDAEGFQVEVINLDLRSMIRPVKGRDHGFLEAMLDRLNLDDSDSLVAPLWEGCQGCRARTGCPVHFNLRALQKPAPRRALTRLLERAELDPEVHLSPRNLWGFLYRMITGGLERYHAEGRDPGQGPCEVVRRKFDVKDSAWLLAGHFTEQVFAHEELGGPWATLARLNPAFATAFSIDRLHTQLTIVKNHDADPSTIEHDLGGDADGVLCGLQLDRQLAQLDAGYPADLRRDVAVRRHVFFNAETFRDFDGVDHPEHVEELLSFDALLEAYRLYSLGTRAIELGLLDRRQQQGLIDLCDLIQKVIVASYGRTLVGGTTLLRVSQPNARSSSKLFIRAEAQHLKKIFDVKALIHSDVHVVAHHERNELLKIYGYRPDTLTLNIAGYRLVVDERLYGFLHSVQRGQQPSAVDLAQFQALRYAGERLGNILASQGELSDVYILDGRSHKLHVLQRNPFGQAVVHPHDA